jgi:hypothetical protein
MKNCAGVSVRDDTRHNHDHIGSATGRHLGMQVGCQRQQPRPIFKLWHSGFAAAWGLDVSLPCIALIQCGPAFTSTSLLLLAPHCMRTEQCSLQSNAGPAVGAVLQSAGQCSISRSHNAAPSLH